VDFCPFRGPDAPFARQRSYHDRFQMDGRHLSDNGLCPDGVVGDPELNRLFFENPVIRARSPKF
jgi:hypothetical protein